MAEPDAPGKMSASKRSRFITSSMPWVAPRAFKPDF
jgi:hypothetical protein